MAGRIAITPRSLSASGHPALGRLVEAGFEVVYPAPGRQPTEADLLAVVPGCVGWLAGVEPIGRAVLEAAPDLRVISRNGVGVDNVDLAAAADRGIAVRRAAGANARGVAELALALMLAGLRHVPWSDRHLRSGEWSRRTGAEAEGRTLGLFGCGAIGQILSRLALALDMKVLAFDPVADTAFAPGPGFRYAAPDEIFAAADVISLHCPPGERPLLDAEALGRMRQGVVVVNTARAELVDDRAMLAALDSGRVAVFATDVYHAEPPPSSSLLAHENVILTPHAGGATVESVERATRIAVDNLLDVLVR